MPVTIYPAPHEANEVRILKYEHYQPTASPRDFLERACQDEEEKIKELIQSSFQDIKRESNIFPNNNGFVNTCVKAYNEHHHLTLRPDDIWIAILSQFNIYVNANAEALRQVFVSHEGKKELVIMERGCDPKGDPKFGVNWGQFSFKMTKLLSDNVKDPSLRDWILPQFTTTLKSDQAVASVLFMSTMQKYFSYGCMVCCGLPSVTLAGEKKDWENLVLRAEKLPEFGKECEEWLTLLRPVLTRFVKTFDDNGQETKDFWQKIVHYYGGGSGPSYLSGWITAFCFWRQDGICLYGKGKSPSKRWPTLEIDNAVYHRVETSEVPAGWASVPVKIDNNGSIHMCNMVAGSVGYRASSSGKPLSGKAEAGLDSVAVENGWWIYETNEKVAVE